MPITIQSVHDLRNYFKGVVTRSKHHAPKVDQIIYSLVGHVILKPGFTTLALSLGSRNGAKAPRTSCQFFRALSALQKRKRRGDSFVMRQWKNIY
ncbi:hypothetical protein LIL_40020 (plasmid) [Leptospira interrogans serovar Linhai str. 56609]|nr:hypothetical protein LIL_40020 [Leptospira interrogans serovar Linhai str. 56609]